jgi:hypothetical protein
MQKEIKHIVSQIKPILDRYGIISASIVGSLAREEFTDESDIDLVVEIDHPMSLLTFSAIKIELEEKLQRKVDLIEKSAIKPRLRHYLLSDEIPVA